MADLIFVAVIVAFFAIAGLFVVACDHIIGADDKQAQGRGAVSPTPDDGPTGSSVGDRSRMSSQAQIADAVSLTTAAHRLVRASEIGAA